jgi:hypothetical protein
MSLTTPTLIWLFPLAFMLHDFEELILSEPWLRKNAADIKLMIQNRAPAFLAPQISGVLDKSATEFAFPVCLIFSLVFLSSFLAAEYGQYGFFLLASGLYFLHGFAHIAQAIALRRYIPAMITSALIAIPYGLVLYGRLLAEGIVDLPRLLIYFLVAALLGVPFILVMHKLGEYLYKMTVSLLIR